MSYVVVSSKVDLELSKAIRELHKQHSDIVEYCKSSGADVTEISGSTVISCNSDQYELIRKKLGL